MRSFAEHPPVQTDVTQTELELARLDAEVERLRQAIDRRRAAGAAEHEVAGLRALRDELATHLLAARTLLDAGATDKAHRLLGDADRLRERGAPPAA